MENNNLSSSEGCDVFDLYGGKEAVLERADKLIRLKLKEEPSKLKKRILEDIMKLGGPTGNKVIEYLKGKIKVNRDIFLAFKPYLHLKVGDALGKPCFASEEIRGYWIAEKKNKPIRMIVAEPLPENPFEGEKGLELYTGFRAIGKFYRSA